MKSLEIRWHVGVGDAIVQCGLLHHFLAKHRPDEVCVPATAEGEPTVRHLFEGVAEAYGARLFLRGVQDLSDTYKLHHQRWWEGSIIETVGAAHPGFVYSHWDRSFYDQHGVDPTTRLKLFNLPEDVYDRRTNGLFNLLPKRADRKLVLVHEVPRRGKRIPLSVFNQYGGRPDYKVVKIEPHGSLLNWAPLMAAAEELHLVDSGPANLANSLYLRARLNIYAQNTPPPTMLNPENQTSVHYIGTYRPTHK